jgi:8-oxo-dGTP diphosphatase
MNVVGCYLEYEGNILLLQIAEGKEYAGHWGVPAGKQEKGELPDEGVLREIQEETGLKLQDIAPGEELYVRLNSGDFRYTLFRQSLTERPEITLIPREHQAFCWVTPQEALNLPLLPDEDACLRYFYPHVQ